jgi:phage baseplate assembly protein W
MFMTETADFLGSGLAFPMRVDALGGIAMSRHERNVEESMFIVLSTPIGERRMRPRFGCGVHDLTFATNDPATRGLIRYHVVRALNLWEPRVQVRDQDVEVRADAAEPARVLVDIGYTLRTTNQRRNLVFPFYLAPGEE